MTWRVTRTVSTHTTSPTRHAGNGSRRRHPTASRVRERATLPRVLRHRFVSAVVPAATAAVVLSGAAGAADADAASVKRIKTVSAKTTAKTWPLERGAGASRNSSLPRGVFCRGDSGSFRLWWSEVAANQAVADDGNCKTVPSVVQITADQLSDARRGAVTLGLRPARGDDQRPAHERNWPVGGSSHYDVMVIGHTSTIGEAGLNSCRSASAGRSSRTLRNSTAMRLFVGPPSSPVSETSLRATITHEYFHGMQCTSLGLNRLIRARGGLRFSSPPTELIEATAEWFASTVYPQGDAGELLVGGDMFTLGRGATLCSMPTDLLSGADRQAPYTAGAVLAGAFGATRGDARRIVSGLRKARTTRLSTPFATALRKAYGAARLQTGMVNAIQRACVGRTTVTGEVPLLAGTPMPQRPVTQELRLTPANRTGVAGIQVGPLSTAVIVAFSGYPGPTSHTVNVTSSAPTSLAAYTTSSVVTTAAFDAAGSAVVPNDSGIVVVVVANPSLTQALTAQVTVTAVGP